MQNVLIVVTVVLVIALVVCVIGFVTAWGMISQANSAGYAVRWRRLAVYWRKHENDAEADRCQAEADAALEKSGCPSWESAAVVHYLDLGFCVEKAEAYAELDKRLGYL